MSQKMGPEAKREVTAMAINGSGSLRPSGHLGGSRLRDQDDPMSSMGNLMDVMLVFACGIMIALIAHYNVQLSPDDPDVGNAQRVDAEVSDAVESIEESDSTYSEVGTLYRDEETGELYVVVPEDEASEGVSKGAEEKERS